MQAPSRSMRDEVGWVPQPSALIHGAVQAAQCGGCFLIVRSPTATNWGSKHLLDDAIGNQWLRILALPPRPKPFSVPLWL